MAATKRKATTEAHPPSSTSRRQSARAKKVKVVYAESDAEESGSGDEFNGSERSGSEEEEEDVGATEDGEDEGRGEEDSEVEVEERRGEGGSKANKGSLKARKHAATSTGGDPGVDGESEVEGEGEGMKWKKTITSNGREQMVIDLPGKKDAGDTPYEDGRLHANTLEFLRELKRNNKREWLKFHDVPFRQAERDFQSFVGELNTRVCAIDPTIPDLAVKDIIYRIHRDMRFTTDPTPYKTYLAVTWSRTGRKGPYAHYYLHVQPGGESFCGGGYFGCDSETLACLREDIDTQPHRFKSVLMGDQLRKTFFPAVKRDEGRVVAAFCEMSQSNALKKKPKGFDADHQDIELLKLRNYVLTKKIPDHAMTGKDGLTLITDIMEAMEPFISYLNHTVMPDPDTDSE